MRILVTSPYLPWPLSSGGAAAQFASIKCLSADHQFTLVYPVHDDAEKAHARTLGEQLPGVVVRAVDCGEPAMSRGRQTARRILRFCQRKLDPITSQPVLPGYPFTPPSSRLIEAVGEELSRGTDLFQAEFAPMLPLGAWVPESIPRLFVHHQIQFVYSERFLQTHGPSHAANFLHAMMKTQELGYLRHFDAIITFSEEDRSALSQHLDPAAILSSPFPIPADVGITRDIPRDFDGRFLFVASDVHDPNVDALEWLAREIWPDILRKLPSARLQVIGEWREALRQRFGGPGISFSGFIPDLAAAMRGGIMLVPVRIGSGVRTKILAALAQGIPTITTPVGVEGLLVRPSEDLMVCSNPAEFASAAIRLASEADLRLKLATAGHTTVVGTYSADRVRRRRNEIYAAVASRGRRSDSSDPNASSRSAHSLAVPIL